jgi:DNA polymerase sigma
MIINFLQTRDPPILPSLHQRAHKNYIANDGTESGFDDVIEPLRNFGAANKSSLGELLFQFYRYYGFEFKYDKFIVSVRHGRLLKREEKGWQTGGKDGHWRLCIEEPFNSTRNLGNSADATAFRGIHLELRSAFMHICSLDLDKLMEKYEFPPEEKHIFKRPQVSKPTLAAPSQNSNRKHFGPGGSMRSNRPNGRGNHSAASSRRSSTSQLGRNNFAPYISSPMLPPEFLSAESLNHYQWQQWQMLGLCSLKETSSTLLI